MTASSVRILRAYALAVLAAGLALALTWPTTRPLGGAYLYFPLIAVFVTALREGFGPGIVTVVLCALGFDLLYFGPPFRLGVSSTDEAHRLAGFLLFGTAASWIAARARASRREAEAARRAAEAASAEARRIGAQQEQLVAIVSHDLRNPLGALGGNVGLIGRLGPLTERQAHVLANMRGTVTRMERMIRDLLDLARSRQGGLIALSLEDVRVGEICTRVLAETSAAHPDANVLLAVDGDDRARLDPERIAQVVSNLVVNAVQHGAHGAPIRVRVEPRGEDIAIGVENAGSPISAELATGLFEPFRRGSAGGLGVGLGLFVVREIARAHGGAVAFRSELGENVFEVRLPRGAGGPAPSEVGSRSP